MVSLFDVSTLAIRLPHDSSPNGCDGLGVPLSAFLHINNMRFALHHARYSDGKRDQIDMYDNDGEVYLTHDRTLWWSGRVYASDSSIVGGRWLGLVMAIVKQDVAELGWDTDTMHHRPDAMNEGRSHGPPFTYWGDAVQSVQPGWWMENVEFRERRELEA